MFSSHRYDDLWWWSWWIWRQWWFWCYWYLSLVVDTNVSPIHYDLDEEDGDDDGGDYCDGVDFCGTPCESKRTTWGLRPSHSVHFRIWFTRGLIILDMRWMLCMWQISCLHNCCASFASRVSCVSCLQLHLFVLFCICLVCFFVFPALFVIFTYLFLPLFVQYLFVCCIW